MVSKTILMLLGAVLLLQCYDARYLELENTLKFKDKESALRAVAERLKLMKFAEVEHSVIDRDLVSKGKIAMEKVLKDPKVLEVTTEDMKKILDEMRLFLKNYAEFEKSGKTDGKELNEIVERYDSIVDQYADEKTGRDTPEAKILTNSFKENGFVRFGKSNEEQTKVFIDKVCIEVEKYIDGLTEDEKKQDPKILEFLKELKEETDLEKRDIIIWKFFGMITLDDFLW